jgi:hypothetical protein
MSLYFGNTAIKNAYLSNTQMSKAYLGNALVYSKGGDYLSILSDGNTASWYAFDDNTLKKDGNNKVAAWGDKLTYTEGPELIDQNNWYKLSYYQVYGANWSQNVNYLHSNGASGTISRSNFWQIGHCYKISISFTTTSGEIRPVTDNTSVNRVMYGAGSYTYTYYIVPAATGMGHYSNGWLGDITSLSVKEVPINTIIQNDFVNGTQPLYSANGVLFDGTNDFLKTGAFTLNQPEFIYMVVKPVSWVQYDYIFDGIANNTGAFYDQLPNSGVGVTASAGTASATNNNFTIGNYHIIRILFNGASSKLIVDATTPTTWNCGSANMGGFCLGKVGTAALYYGNIQVKEIIIRKTSDSSNDETVLFNYLKTKYGL